MTSGSCWKIRASVRKSEMTVTYGSEDEPSVRDYIHVVDWLKVTAALQNQKVTQHL